MSTAKWRRENNDKLRAYRRKWYHTGNNKRRQVARQMQRRKELVAFFKEQKRGKKCIKCGECHPATLDFHHRNRETKLFNLRDRGLLSSERRILEEIAKCDVLCANCHRKLHWNEKHSDVG